MGKDGENWSDIPDVLICATFLIGVPAFLIYAGIDSYYSHQKNELRLQEEWQESEKQRIENCKVLPPKLKDINTKIERSCADLQKPQGYVSVLENEERYHKLLEQRQEIKNNLQYYKCPEYTLEVIK